VSHKVDELTTPDGRNEIIVFNERLTAGQPVEEQYKVAAAWQGSGWASPVRHVAQVLSQAKHEPQVNVLLEQKTPHPERLESEPQ
jgi:hypothetical protein